MYKGPIPQRCLALDYESESINKEIQHCCEMMEKGLSDPSIALSYTPKYREYFIPVLYKGRARGNVSALQIIAHCPWCNKKLPEGTRDQWFDILEQEYQIDDPWDKEQELLVPQEFKTDEWWINRNL